MLKSEFLNVVNERGFFHQCTDLQGLDQFLAQEKPVTAYIGFDCTAPSLHVGNLMQIMILRWLQKCGHRPIVLMGGGTTKIGDPSGKDEARKVLSEEQINANMEGIKAVFSKFLQFGNVSNDALMVNNDDWLKNVNLLEFMRDYGRHFSVNRMLTMDSVKLRLERDQHLSLLEFMYMAMQAYDFMELSKKYDCHLQIGGSDQWGNIVMGAELGRKESSQLFGLTTPLITTSSGAKMGKTASGAVWLNADMLSPFDYWQFWRNTEDGDVGRFLRLFTEISIAEIERLERLQGGEINEAKKILANEATALCHGKEAAAIAAETARVTFEQGGAGENLKTLFIEKSKLDGGISASEFLHMLGIKESKGEARKLIEGGGARLNDEKITDPRMMISSTHLTVDGYIKVSAGKKQHVLVKTQ